MDSWLIYQKCQYSAQTLVRNRSFNFPSFPLLWPRLFRLNLFKRKLKFNSITTNISRRRKREIAHFQVSHFIWPMHLHYFLAKKRTATERQFPQANTFLCFGFSNQNHVLRVRERERENLNINQQTISLSFAHKFLTYHIDSFPFGR